MTKTLGQRIRELREGDDLSLRELAQRLGIVSAAFLSDVELGRRHPSDSMLSKMAEVLRTTMEDLKQYDTRPPGQELRRIAIESPKLGFALRRVIDKVDKGADADKVAEDILKIIEGRPGKGPKK